MRENLIDYLYRKCQDDRLEICPTNYSREIISSIFLAKVNNECVIYYVPRGIYELKDGTEFWFRKK